MKRKNVFTSVYERYTATKEQYNSIDWWNHNFITIVSHFLEYKQQAEKELLEFKNSRVCKRDKSGMLYSMAFDKCNAIGKDCDDNIIKVTKDYMEAVQRIESNHKTL